MAVASAPSAAATAAWRSPQQHWQSILRSLRQPNHLTSPKTARSSGWASPFPLQQWWSAHVRERFQHELCIRCCGLMLMAYAHDCVHGNCVQIMEPEEFEQHLPTLRCPSSWPSTLCTSSGVSSSNSAECTTTNGRRPDTASVYALGLGLCGRHTAVHTTDHV